MANVKMKLTLTIINMELLLKYQHNNCKLFCATPSPSTRKRNLDLIRIINIQTGTDGAVKPVCGLTVLFQVFSIRKVYLNNTTEGYKRTEDNTSWLWTQSVDCESSKVNQTQWAQLSLWSRSARWLTAVTLFRLTHVHCHRDSISTQSQEVFSMLMADTFLVSLDVWSVNQLEGGTEMEK